MKTCKHCKKKKDYSEFGIDRTRKDGANTQCKECNRNMSYEYKMGKPRVEEEINKKEIFVPKCPCEEQNYHWRREHPCTHK